MYAMIIDHKLGTKTTGISLETENIQEFLDNYVKTIESTTNEMYVEDLVYDNTRYGVRFATAEEGLTHDVVVCNDFVSELHKVNAN